MSANTVINFFQHYGLIMTLLATSGIVFVGALKSFGLFSKINPKAKKYVYFICSCIASIISCTVYLYVKKSFVWSDWGMTIACVIGYTISIYGVYENTGIRAFLKKILFTPIKNLFKRIPTVLMSKDLTEDKVKLLAMNLGSDILLQLANEVRQKEVVDDAIKSAAADIAENEITQRSAAITNPDQNKSVSDDTCGKNNFFS